MQKNCLLCLERTQFCRFKGCPSSGLPPRLGAKALQRAGTFSLMEKGERKISQLNQMHRNIIST